MVRAPPRVLPRSLALSGVLWGGRPGPICPLPGLGLRAPRAVGLRVHGVPAPGAGVGGGGRPVRRVPRFCGRGGQWGWGLLFLVPSLCLPWAGNKAGVTGVVPVMEGVAPIRLRLMVACRLWARPVWRPGALVRVRLYLREQAAGAGRRALPRPPSRAPRSRLGEGGPSPLA